MILVTGAAGKTGQAVIQALSTQQRRVRALVYRAEHVPRVKAWGAEQVIIGTMMHLTTCKQALYQTEAVYHICPNMHPDEVKMSRQMTEAAQWAGVKRIVYHSVLHPQTEQMSHHWHKLRVEEMLFETDLAFTILQPAAYMQNLAGSWDSIVNEGVYRVPYSPDARFSLVDLRDVAEVAALVLTQPGHEHAIYELSGPQWLTPRQIAQTISDLLARPITVEQTPLDEWATQATQAGLPRPKIDTLKAMFDYYDRFGFVGNPNQLTWLLNRPPTSLKNFLQTLI